MTTYAQTADTLPRGHGVSLPVTIEAKARYDGTDVVPVLAVAGDYADTSGGMLRIRAENGRLLDLHAGDWVVRYVPGDLGVLSDGAYRRFFG